MSMDQREALAEIRLAQRNKELTGAQIDTLIALVEEGPLYDGDVPSKTGRDELIAMGLAVRVCVKACDGYTAANYAGKEVYKARYGGDTIRQAMANRKAARA